MVSGREEIAFSGMNTDIASPVSLLTVRVTYSGIRRVERVQTLRTTYLQTYSLYTHTRSAAYRHPVQQGILNK